MIPRPPPVAHSRGRSDGWRALRPSSGRRRRRRAIWLRDAEDGAIAGPKRPLVEDCAGRRDGLEGRGRIDEGGVLAPAVPTDADHADVAVAPWPLGQGSDDGVCIGAVDVVVEPGLAAVAGARATEG